MVREGQTLPLESFTKASFTSNSKEMVKTKELQPPTLISPAPMQNVFVDPATKGVTFSWAPVDNVREYHIKINRTHRLSGPAWMTKRRPPRSWSQTSRKVRIGGRCGRLGRTEKSPSKARPTSLRSCPKVPGTLALELGDFVQLGHVIEVKGHTEPNARVMVNGQEAVVGSDGAFHHFTNPLPTGENLITVTAQNTKGGVNTVTKAVVIQ